MESDDETPGNNPGRQVQKIKESLLRGSDDGKGGIYRNQVKKIKRFFSTPPEFRKEEECAEIAKIMAVTAIDCVRTGH